MHWYHEVLRKYAVLSGRARRREYWTFVLISLSISISFSLLSAVGMGAGFALLGFLYCIGTLVPGFAVTVRRFHDAGRSAWWLLIGCIPLIGALTILIFLCSDSQPGPNRYGPNPKSVVEAPVPGIPKPIG